MLTIELTANLAGMSVSGDFFELDELLDAIYFIADSEFNEVIGFSSASNILLSLAYDIRHASMGDRDFKFVDNLSSNIFDDKSMKLKSISCNNLYYSVNITMMTCIYIALIIDSLTQSSIQKYTKLTANGYTDTSKTFADCKNKLEKAELLDAIKAKELRAFHKKVKIKREAIKEEPFKLLNEARYHTNILKNFQHKVWNALGQKISQEDLNSLYEEHVLKVTSGFPYYKNILNQFAEYLDLTYLALKTKKERIDVLPQMISNLICLGHEYEELVNTLHKEAIDKKCNVDDLHYSLPEVIKW